jgi:catechol 2,3-dioxygenase-like lactoylglutathione lyase family enzyme
VFDHIGIRVKDLAASVRFYRAALAPLGLTLCSEDASGAGFGPKDAPALWLLPTGTVPPSGPVHLALHAAERPAVERFYRAGIEAGGRDHGAPGLRPNYGESYYAAFLLDPDGNNVEAVCMEG